MAIMGFEPRTSLALKHMLLINLPPQVNNTKVAGRKCLQEEFLAWGSAWGYCLLRSRGHLSAGL